jgi:hypothetical protein
MDLNVQSNIGIIARNLLIMRGLRIVLHAKYY